MTDAGTPSTNIDADENKGVVEDSSPRRPGEPEDSQESMGGQLGHRNAGDLISGNDSDFPEPGARPEHSGEHK